MTAPSINDQINADIRKRDWAKVHLEGDRNPPLTGIFVRMGRWIEGKPEWRRRNG
jgi:hypothetical protein